MGASPACSRAALFLLPESVVTFQHKAAREARHGPNQPDAKQHQHHRDDAPEGRDGMYIAVSHGGRCHHGPPDRVEITRHAGIMGGLRREKRRRSHKDNHGADRGRVHIFAAARGQALRREGHPPQPRKQPEDPHQPQKPQRPQALEHRLRDGDGGQEIGPIAPEIAPALRGREESDKKIRQERQRNQHINGVEDADLVRGQIRAVFVYDQPHAEQRQEYDGELRPQSLAVLVEPVHQPATPRLIAG